MILAPLLAAATFLPAFAPPVDQPLRYEEVAIRPLAGNARVTIHQTLRFTRRGDGYVAQTRAIDHAVEAPPPFAATLGALFATSDGIAVTVAMDGKGRITGAIDAAAAWAAIRAAEEAQIKRIEADPAASPARRASARAVFEQSFIQVSDAQRDARLADMAAALLAPPLPALAVGESRGFTATLRAPSGVLPASGTVTLAEASEARLDYRIELRADPDAAAAAVARLEAVLATRSDPAERAKLAAAVARLRETTYVERTSLTIDRATGMLRQSHTDRIAQTKGSAEAPFESDDLQQIP